MKKISIWILMLLLTVSLVGCDEKEEREEKDGEKLAEKILENAGVDAEIDGDKIVVKGEDGQKITIGSGEWPTSDLAAYIPEFEDGEIASVMESEDSLFIMIEDVSDKDFTAYLEEIQESFPEEAINMETGTGLMYSAGNGNDIGVTLIYEKEAGFSITVSKIDSEED